MFTVFFIRITVGPAVYRLFRVCEMEIKRAMDNGHAMEQNRHASVIVAA